MSTDLRYPVGPFIPPSGVSASDRAAWISQIAELPGQLERAVAGLSDDQLDTPYRPGGWTIRQVVHHLPDSHMNAYIRFRLSLTEDTPLIKPYKEAQWAELEDAKTAPLEPSLALIGAMHERWIRLLKSMSEADWQRSYDHPEYGHFPLTRALAMYAWHGRHHVAHIMSLRKREAW